MKLVMTLLVRNEEDVIRQHIDYHLNNGVDLIIARDNLSEDRTRDILLDYEKQGVLVYQYETEDNYAQSKWVTEMARLAYAKHAADWVMNSDADEFWWVNQGKTLKQFLQGVDCFTDVLIVQRYNFPPTTPSLASFLERMIYREVTSLNPLGNPLPPKVCHRALDDIVVAQGNHAVSSLAHKLTSQHTDQLVIFHFPVRSLKQIERKIYFGGRAYQRSSLDKRIGGTWRQLYIRLQKEGLAGYFEENLVDNDRLQDKLRDGLLVEDRRLLDFFTAHNIPV